MNRKRLLTQPVVIGEDDRARFKANKVVRRLLDEADKRGFGLNQLIPGADQEDLEQFYQLIGYTVSGYEELADWISDESVAAAKREETRVRALMKR